MWSGAGIVWSVHQGGIDHLVDATSVDWLIHWVAGLRTVTA
jgi:hypothetical protein